MGCGTPEAKLTKAPMKLVLFEKSWRSWNTEPLLPNILLVCLLPGSLALQHLSDDENNKPFEGSCRLASRSRESRVTILGRP